MKQKIIDYLNLIKIRNKIFINPFLVLLQLIIIVFLINTGLNFVNEESDIQFYLEILMEFIAGCLTWNLIGFIRKRL